MIKHEPPEDGDEYRPSAMEWVLSGIGLLVMAGMFAAIVYGMLQGRP